MRVSCQKGPTRHAYAWQIGPFWQDTLDYNISDYDGPYWQTPHLLTGSCMHIGAYQSLLFRSMTDNRHVWKSWRVHLKDQTSKSWYSGEITSGRLEVQGLCIRIANVEWKIYAVSYQVMGRFYLKLTKSLCDIPICIQMLGLCLTCYQSNNLTSSPEQQRESLVVKW